MSWEKRKLIDCCISIADGDHQPPPKSEKGIPFVTIANIVNNQFDFGNSMFVPESYYENIDNKRKAQKGDILYSVVGSFGIPVFIKENKPFVFQRHIAILRPNKNIDPRFLYYTMLSRDFYMKADAAAIGAAQRTVSLTALRNIEITVPPIETQRRIADILSAYDDLIDNNRKQIKLLEEAAQRLYQEWFVDLRFPGHEYTEIVDGVPEGWETATLGDICSVRKETLPLSKIDDDVPYIGLEHMPRKDICLSEWGDSSKINSSKFRYYEDDILFGKIRPYFHKVGFALNSGVASTDAIILRNAKGLWSLLLMTVTSSEFVSYTYQNCKEGAKMPRADWKQMKSYPIMIADPTIQNTFENQIYTITRKIKCLALQIKRLSEARDRLLPKLMSGEVEV